MWAVPLLLSLQVTVAAASGKWIDVPFVAQGPGGCGPAAAAMVEQYWDALGTGGRHTVPSKTSPLESLKADPQLGVTGAALENALRRTGFRTFIFQGEERDLEHHLARGRPLIVCLSNGTDDDLAHFVVVVGIDTDEGLLYLNDPAQRKLLAIPRSDFVKRWKASGNWTLLALPGSVD